jgi:hypothetical protein
METNESVAANDSVSKPAVLLIHKPVIVRTANDMLWHGVELGRDNV